MTLPDEVLEALMPYVDVDAAIDPHEIALARRHNARSAADAFLAAVAEHIDYEAALAVFHRIVGNPVGWRSSDIKTIVDAALGLEDTQ